MNHPKQFNVDDEAVQDDKDDVIEFKAIDETGSNSNIGNSATKEKGQGSDSDVVKNNDGSENDDEYNPFWFELINNLVFVLGSILYLIMAIESLEWYHFKINVPEEVLKADDDWTWQAWYNETSDVEPWVDDYVFQANTNDPYSWVSRFMMLYFSAAFCFLVTGLMDFWMERRWYYLIMVVAAVFGLASSMLFIKNERLSIIFNSVSVHLFAVEAVLLVLNPDTRCKQALLCAHCFFLVGTLTDVVLSYFYVYYLDQLPHGRASVAAAFFWLASGCVETGVTLYTKIRPRTGVVNNDDNTKKGNLNVPKDEEEGN